MSELRYAILDENGFVIELEDKQCENSIGIYTETNSEFALGYRKYRFDTEKNEFIYDESNVIEECKESLKLEVELSLRNENKNFDVELDYGKYTFCYDKNIKQVLLNNQNLAILGLNNLFKIKCMKDGINTTIKPSKQDLAKILEKVVTISNDLEDSIESHKEKINELKSLKDIEEYKKEYKIDITKNIN